jgi:hypothetical protein
MLELFCFNDEALNDSSVADINDIDDLIANSGSFFLEDGTFIAGDEGSGALAGRKFFFVGGVSTNNPTNGVVLRKSRVVANPPAVCVKKSYIAPVDKIIEVGYNGSSGSLNLPGSLVVGTVATLKVFKTEDFNTAEPIGNRMSNFGVRINGLNVAVRVTATHTATTLMEAVRDAINNNPANDFVSAAVTGAGATLNLELTGTKTGQSFYVAVDDLLADATVTTTTDITYGHGTPQQIIEIENLANIENGDEARIKFASKFWQVPSQVNTSLMFLTYELQWDAGEQPEIGLGGNVRNRIILAVADGRVGSSESAIDDVLDVLGITVVDGDAW